jgi:sec-independent protein translocase protein TatB
MLDLSWQELFLIAVVALVVIGPKDLPQVMRSVAGFVRKAKGLSREFQNGIAQMMREAELDELRRKLEEAGRVDVGKTVKDTIDPTGSLSAEFDPAEFARDLKRSVEEPTIHRPSAADGGEAPESEGQPANPAGNSSAERTGTGTAARPDPDRDAP